MKIKMKIRIKMRKGFFLSLSLNLFFWSMVYSPYFAAWRGNFSGITVSEGVWEGLKLLVSSYDRLDDAANGELALRFYYGVFRIGRHQLVASRGGSEIF